MTTDELKLWCDTFQIRSHIETSSKTATNVDDAFILAVRQWKHMERIAEIELKQSDTIDLTRTIRLAQNRFCCTGGGGGGGGSSAAATTVGISFDSEDESMHTPSPRRFGKRVTQPQQTHYQL